MKEEIIKIVIQELEDRKIIKKEINLFSETKSLLENMNRIEKSINSIQKRIKKLEQSKNSITLPKLQKSGIFIETSFKNMNLDSINSQIIELIQTEKNISVFIDFIKEIVKETLDEESADMLISIYFKTKNKNERKKSIMQMSEKYHYDESNIYKKINKAIREISLLIFPEKYIQAIYY